MVFGLYRKNIETSIEESKPYYFMYKEISTNAEIEFFLLDSDVLFTQNLFFFNFENLQR